MDGCTEMINQYNRHWIKPFMPVFLLIGMVIYQPCGAEDSLSAVMQRITTQSAIKIAYQETRSLELMDKPWIGTGYMYFIPPDLMIREQQQPQRLLMGVKGETLYYFDPVRNIRYQREMERSHPLALDIILFQALVNADKALLERLFTVNFSTRPQRWLITLTPRYKENSHRQMTVSGLSQQPVDTVIIQQSGGDLTEFMLKKVISGSRVKPETVRLYHKLLGD